MQTVRTRMVVLCNGVHNIGLGVAHRVVQPTSPSTHMQCVDAHHCSCTLSRERSLPMDKLTPSSQRCLATHADAVFIKNGTKRLLTKLSLAAWYPHSHAKAKRTKKILQPHPTLTSLCSSLCQTRVTRHSREGDVAVPVRRTKGIGINLPSSHVITPARPLDNVCLPFPYHPSSPCPASFTQHPLHARLCKHSEIDVGLTHWDTSGWRQSCCTVRRRTTGCRLARCCWGHTGMAVGPQSPRPSPQLQLKEGLP